MPDLPHGHARSTGGLEGMYMVLLYHMAKLHPMDGM